MIDRRPQTVDGGKNHRPRSIIIRLIAVPSIVILLVGCRFRIPAITIALLGDINLGRGVTPGPDSLAYLTPDLRSADLALANLESPLGSDGPTAVPDGGYNLCTSSTRAALLADWGFDLLSLTNNHRLDCGPEGITETQTALDSAGLTPIGPGYEPVYRSVKGLKLAFFAFDDISSPLDAEAAVRAIRTARLGGAVVVVSVHWGNEYQGGASQRQKSLAQQFAAAGAALVWGHHPHVLQPVEWINPPAGSEPGRGRSLVLYSLGNALFDQHGLEDTRRSALVEVKIGRDGVESVRAVPFIIDTTHSRVSQPEAGTAEKIMDRLQIP